MRAAAAPGGVNVWVVGAQAIAKEEAYNMTDRSVKFSGTGNQVAVTGG